MRLALLTACRSAQPGAHLPDETINLPTALLRAGCAACVGTLWAVPARTAAVFTAVFARNWLDRDLDPATATRAAVDDLRTIDHVHECEELGDPVPSTGVPARFRPHAHAARWAAFICTGW
jgi:CHAT domain-containing protein